MGSFEAGCITRSTTIATTRPRSGERFGAMNRSSPERRTHHQKQIDVTMGRRAFDGESALAPTFPQRGRGAGVAVGDGFDIHGNQNIRIIFFLGIYSKSIYYLQFNLKIPGNSGLDSRMTICESGRFRGAASVRAPVPPERDGTAPGNGPPASSSARSLPRPPSGPYAITPPARPRRPWFARAGSPAARASRCTIRIRRAADGSSVGIGRERSRAATALPCFRSRAIRTLLRPPGRGRRDALHAVEARRPMRAPPGGGDVRPAGAVRPALPYRTSR